MKKIDKFSRGMGIGGWLTNYKRPGLKDLLVLALGGLAILLFNID